MTDLNAKQLKFVDEFVHCQNQQAAAKSAGYKEGFGGRLYAMPAIRTEIDRRMVILNTEQAKQTIKKRELCKELLDDELTALIKIDVKDVIEKPALGATKREAIEMGYRRTGLLAGGEFIPDQDTQQPRPDELPRIYRATEASVITHRIETVQQVTTRELVSTPAPQIESESPYDF